MLDWGTDDEGNTQDSGEVDSIFVNSIYAEVPYIAFNPARATSLHKLYLAYPFDYPCLVISALYPVHTSLVGVMTSVALNEIAAEAAWPTIPRINIPVDVSIVTGTFNLYNGDEVVPIVKSEDGTRKDVEPLSFDDYQEPQSEDLNNNGKPDHVSDNGSIPQPDGSPDDAAPLYGVWFSVPEDAVMDDKNVPYTEDGDLIKPDLVRVATYKQSFDNVGLVKSISYTDLADTDIFVFRESTGQLVMEKKPFVLDGDYHGGGLLWGNQLSGIAEEETVGGGSSKITAYFETRIPGRSGRNSTAVGMYSKSTEDYRAWQSGARVTALGVDTENKQSHIIADDFQAFSETLRKGEPLRIIVINRATGYIGSKRINVEDIEKSTNPDVPTPYLNDSTIGVNIGEIQLFPPNLKINVKRHYEVEYGATQGDEKIYRIGSEGSALASDQYVVITSEWLDEDGSPLPAELPGYTGRLTSLSSDAKLKNSAKHFAIKPGLHTEIISLGDEGSKPTGAQYQYLHIVGEDETEVADFGASPNANNRPDKFVPFRVAVYNATASKALQQAQLENADESISQDSSVYQWPHRPEMMYSIFDLDIAEILRTPEDEDGEAVEPIDITNNETLVLTASDKELSIVQDLIASEYDPLEYFGPESHLIYSLEGYQQQVNEGEGETYSFTDFGHLGELDSDDYLTLNLLNSQDAGNVLWEFAFEYLSLSLANDEEVFLKNRVYVSADDANIDLSAILLGYANRGDKETQVVLDWKVEEGQATVTPEERSFPVNGVIKSTVEVDPFVENVVEISAYLHDSTDVKVHSIEIGVQAGDVTTISLQSGEGTAYVQGKGAHNMVVSLRDKNGNLVSDGTPVSVDVVGTARLDEVQSATEDGKVSFSVKGTVASGEVVVSVFSNGIEKHFPVNIKPLTTEVIGMPSTFVPGVRYKGLVKVTNASGAPQSGVPVELYAVGADVVLNGHKTNSDGELSFEAMINEFAKVSRVMINAHADKQSVATEGYLVGELDEAGATGFSVLPVGTNSKNTIVADLADGSECSIDLSEPTITLTGTPFSQVELPENDKRYPNIQPTLSSDIYSNKVTSLASFTATKTYVYSDSDSPNLQGFSARFGENGEWSLAPNISLRVEEPTISFWFKPSAEASSTSKSILTLGADVLELKSRVDRKLELVVNTETGSQILESTNSIDASWHYISLGRQGDEYYLYVDDNKVSLQSSSALVYSSSTAGLTVGGLDGMKIGSLTVFDNTNSQLVQPRLSSTQYDENGKATIRYQRASLLEGSSYLFGGQRIQWRHNDGRLVALLVEDDQLATYASMYSQNIASPCTPLHLVQLAGATGVQVSLERSMAKHHAEIKVADLSSMVEIAKSGLRWIEHHPDNRGTAAAMQKLQSYLVSPAHDILAGYMDDELSRAINEWKAGSNYRMLTLLTGMQVWSEMIDASPLAADLLVENVKSSADFWTWMRYLSLPGKGWAGGVIPLPLPSESCDNWKATVNVGTDYAYNPKPCRVSGQVAANSIVDIYDVEPNDSDEITPLLRSTIKGFRDAPFLLTKMIFESGDSNSASLYNFDLISSAHATPVGKVAKGFNSMLKHIMKQLGEKGPDNIIGFLKNETNARFSPAQLFGAMFYLASRSEENKDYCERSSSCELFNAEARYSIENNIKNNVKRLILGIGLSDKGNIVDNADAGRMACIISWQAHGAGMELVLTAMYHLLYESGLEEYEILAGDKLIKVPYVVSKNSVGELVTSTTGRVPDLILKGDGLNERRWIEAKSWALGRDKKGVYDKAKILSGAIKHWEWEGTYKNKGKYVPGHRQYILDSIAVDRSEDLGAFWEESNQTQYLFVPKTHKTWIQVWNQETRTFHYKKKSGLGYTDETSSITMARSWVELKNGKALTEIGDDFPVLQGYFSTLPKKWGENNLEYTVGLSSGEYAEKLRDENFKNTTEGKLNGIVAPFTLGSALISEAGAGVKASIIESLEGHLGDHPFFRELDLNEITAAQREALEEAVLNSAKDNLQAFSAVFDGIEYIDEKVGVAVDKVLDIIAYLGGEDVANGIDEAKRLNQYINEAMEGIVAEMIRDGSGLEYVSIPFSDIFCEQVQ